MNKKGLSSIIGTVIMIALVFAVGIIVWAGVKNLVDGKLDNAGSCVDVLEKVSLNSAYTCVDTSGYVLFSINRGDVAIDAIIIKLSGDGTTRSIILNETPSSGLTYYNGSTGVVMPGNNTGLTYNYSWSSVPSSISVEIAPLVGSKQCDAVDKIESIGDCSIVLP